MSETETDVDIDERRFRKFTEPGREQFEDKVYSFQRKLDTVWFYVRQEIDRGLPSADDTQSLKTLEINVRSSFANYRSTSDKYLDYLNAVHTKESVRLAQIHTGIRKDFNSIVDKFLDKIMIMWQKPGKSDDVMSKHSSRSAKSSGKGSRVSSTSSYAARAKAKAEALKVKMEYIEREAALRKKQAQLAEKEMLTTASTRRQQQEIEADIQVLEGHKLYEEAKTEAEVLQVIDEWQDNASYRGSELSKPMQDPIERTKRYVYEHSSYGSMNTDPEHKNGIVTSIKVNSDVPQTNDYLTSQPRVQGHLETEGRGQTTLPNPVENKPDNKTISNPFGGLSDFLLKKELLVSRLTKFDDKPESFLAWKMTFRTVLSEMKVNPSEEIDLLIKWLGTESGKYAVSMRNASAGNHKKGLKQIWERLEERYGNAEMIESALKHKLTNFSEITYKDKRKLYELSDILAEVQSAKENPQYAKLLSYFDTSAGVTPIVLKLPFALQNKWREKATRYKQTNNVSFPPFEFFVEFVHGLAKMMNDPGFVFESSSGTSPTQGSQRSDKRNSRTKVSAAKTNVSDQPTNQKVRCVIHKANHSLNECRTFKEMSLDERRQILRKNGLCFKCLISKDHVGKDCRENIACKTCGSNRHSTGMHCGPKVSASANTSQSYGGEMSAPYMSPQNNERERPAPQMSGSSHLDPQKAPFIPSSHTIPSDVNSKCTEVCKGKFGGKSCAKILPVNISHSDNPNKRVKIYTILDEQSNRSLAKGQLFDTFNIQSPLENYTLSSCAGRVVMSGRRSGGFIVESMDGSVKMQLPTIIECEDIPNNKDEIPTKEIANYHPHLYSIADELAPLDEQSDILLLIGRDLLEAHHIIEQKLGPPNKPYAQRLKLGWVVIGETCLGGSHTPDVTSMKTYITAKGRPTLFKPCDNEICVQDIAPLKAEISAGETVFVRSKNDDKPGMSIEDKSFMKLMSEQCHMGQEGKWVAPLPFRSPKPTFPNNRFQALCRARNLDFSLKKDPVKCEHFVAFMQELLESGHAEVAPPLSSSEECWYLPLFGVYHPKKKDQIRCVFDSSAKYNGVSLNDTLLTGPDLVNSLVGVLMRFRKDKVAITADIKKMFYCFMVRLEDRNYLRFIWHKDNDINKELVDFRMRVHVFGNSPSPAVATYCLRKTAEVSENVYGNDVRKFVDRNFYVDDALSSHPSSAEAVDLLQRTQKALKENGSLHLHKISSNSKEVLSAFPPEDLAKDLMDLDFQNDLLPLQRSLGLIWDVNEDLFKFQVSDLDKPFTRRGVLSVVNSIFDPLGFISPVTIQGKLILRKFMRKGLDWDDAFQAEDYKEWRNWTESLESLKTLQIPRSYVDMSVTESSRCEIHAFSDASEVAIAAVLYLRVIDKEGASHVGFLCGNVKVAPSHGHTVPRLELCAAVMAVQVTEFALEQLDLKIDSVKFYSDSRVVLGYVQNETRRFYVYVGNRVDIIRKYSDPEQWNYIPTHLNPADLGTRSVRACDLQDSVWLKGPVCFLEEHVRSTESELHDLVNPENDHEVRPVDAVRTVKTDVELLDLIEIGTGRYKRFSTWNSLVRAISVLKTLITQKCISSVETFERSEKFIIKSVQQEVYKSEILCLKKGGSISKSSHIINLDPYLDQEGILRVGGRLNRMSTETNDKNPLILPGSHHVSTLLVRHYHEKVKHMGRHFTAGSVRSAGLWITGMKRLIASVLHKCVICRKLRAKTQHQKMSDLPSDRLEPAPPFTNVGLDVFGPWSIVTRKTRGGQANSKRWAVIFSCLVTRAIHIEVIEEMTSSAFINALRRFVALRGNVKIIRSDRGTNFVGATNDLGIDCINVEDAPLKKFLFNSGCVWMFNSPHSSHMGGAWERMVGISRRILDSMLLNLPNKNLTHDVLVTLMAEVTAIVNARPLVPVSSDSESPFVLSPATLLTMKTDHSVKSFTVEDFSVKDLYKSQWRQVQCLANQFWMRWKNEYLHLLQGRRKWQSSEQNLKENDVVLLKDKSLHRNQWPLGIIQNAIVSDDGLVRKVEVRTRLDGTTRVFTRPVTEVVCLLSDPV